MITVSNLLLRKIIIQSMFRCSIPTRPTVPDLGPGPHIVPDHIGGGGSLGPGASGIGGKSCRPLESFDALHLNQVKTASLVIHLHVFAYLKA